MRIDPLEQLYSAAAALILGIAVCMFYDVLRALRRRAGNPVFTAVCDVVFCLTAFAGLFVLGFAAGEGKQRIYMTVTSLLGGTVYFAVLSKLVYPLCAMLANLLAAAVRLVLLPLRFAAGCVKKLSLILKNVFHYAVKWYTINWGKELMPKTVIITRRRAPSEGTLHNENQKGRYYY